jgi:hypothetical protein
VLTLCRAFSSDEPAAALALARWDAFEDAWKHHAISNEEQRFRRRAYERVRDRALVAITLRSASWLIRLTGETASSQLWPDSVALSPPRPSSGSSRNRERSTREQALRQPRSFWLSL